MGHPYTKEVNTKKLNIKKRYNQPLHLTEIIFFWEIKRDL